MQSTVGREIVLASGPSTPQLTDVLEHNGILYASGYSSETIDRFDVASSVWLTPINLGNPVTSLAVASTLLRSNVEVESIGVQGVYLVGREPNDKFRPRFFLANAPFPILRLCNRVEH